MATTATQTWETMSQHVTPNALHDHVGSHQVNAKVRKSGACKGYLVVKLWTQQRKSTHLVIDDRLSIIAQGYGHLETESWEMAKAILARKGIDLEG
jgi:hypothetical protein